jgi:phosphoglycolate phosphatase
LIFDLDGTLVDSKKDLTASVNHVRLTLGLPQLTEHEIAGYVGDGARMLIRRALGPEVSDAEVEWGLQLFLSYYRDHMLDQSVLYPGVVEALERLSDFRLAVLTNKPIRFSRMMLEGLGILNSFAAVYGGNSFERKKPDPIGIFQILSDTSGLAQHTWMIGDSAVDVLTGRNAGVKTCERTPPDALIDHVEQLEPLVRKAIP